MTDTVHIDEVQLVNLPDDTNILLQVINRYIADWPYSRPLDTALVTHWMTLPACRLLLGWQGTAPLAFAHGEPCVDTWYLHLLAVMPGAVDGGVALLRLMAALARAAGASRLCGPCWRSGMFYGGYVLGCEPYHPHWAVDATTAYMQAGWRISHPAVLLRKPLTAPVAPRPLPNAYTLTEVTAPAEYTARTVRFLALHDGLEAATCTARLYPNLIGMHDGPVGQVGYVGTDEAHRGKGLAKALVEHCVERLRHWGAREVLIATGLDNTPALRAYESVGFQRFCNLNEWSLML